MGTVQNFFNRHFSTSGKKLLLFIFIFNFTSYNLWRDWRGERHPFISDADQYYSYLVATVIHHDPGFNFPHAYWLTEAKNGARVPKVTMGLAYLMAPFFLIAHGVALLNGDMANGYSSPYAFGIYYSSILFVFLGLLYLRKILIRFFTEQVSTLTIASIYFGTNLMYYTLGWNTIAHPYLFTLFVFFLYFTIRWYETFNFRFMLLLGLVFGLSVLIRPTEIVIALIPFLYGVGKFSDLSARFQLLWKYRIQIVGAIIFFFIPWIPQMIYWKIYTDQFMFYSYGNEGFYYTNPQFFNVLFSYRKGWFVYTPIMIFSVIGFITLKKKCPDFFWGVFGVFFITLYLISAWWAWWWGGCFGMRALIQGYVFLSLPMASFYSYMIENGKRAVLLSTIYVMIAYNIYQTYRYIATVIHWDSMSKEAFWWGIFKMKMTDQDKKEIQPLLEPPDYSKRGE